MCQGILSNSKKEDLETISHIVSNSISYYKYECEKSGKMLDFEIDIHDNFEFISKTGGHALSLSEEFLYPNALQRVATLILLCNAFPPFSITRNGKPYSGEGRKDFVSRFTALLITEALKCFAVEREGDNQQIFLQWIGFPNSYFKRQFLFYLQEIEPLQVQIGRDGKLAQVEFEKAIAHISVGLAMAMTSCVKEGPVRNLIAPTY